MNGLARSVPLVFEVIKLAPREPGAQYDAYTRHQAALQLDHLHASVTSKFPWGYTPDPR